MRAICVNHIQPERAVEATSRGAAPIRSWDGALSDSAPELARFVGEVERELTRTLPRRPVHGDFWDNNVFSRDGRVVLVNDFDHMGVPARIDDVGLTLYFTHLEEGRGQLLGLVDAYVSGLRSLLTARRDRTRLPLALGRQPVWCIGGWVASVRDEAAAHAHTGGMHAAVDFALSIVRELSHWQAFA